MHDTRKNSVINKRKQGIYYTTNIKIIDEILDLSIDSWDKLLELKFFEPSCGNGIFLVRLLNRMHKYGYSLKDMIFFVENKLYFNDLSKNAIDDTKANIYSFFYKYFDYNNKISFNCFNSDFTKKSNNSGLFAVKQLSGYSSLYKSFDVIIGNPPYIALYGRRDKKKKESLRQYFLKNYKQFPYSLKNGKINYVMLFLEHGIDLLKTNGVLSYIIDLSFFETAYCHTRKYLLENTIIEKLIYNITGFDVASGQIIIKLIKRKKGSIDYKIKVLDYAKHRQQEINVSNWNKKTNEYKFEIINNDSLKIVKKILNINKNNFKTLFPSKTVRTCCMLLDMENLFTSSQYDKLKYTYKYFEGSKGLKNKYAPMLGTKFFFYNKSLQNTINDKLKIELEKKGIKNKKRIGLGEIDIYDNPKIFIRQSAKEIIATYNNEKSAANNSLYTISFRNNTEQSQFTLKLLLAQLNSKLISFYAQSKRIIRYSKGKQPQLKISDFNTIPIILNSNIDKKLVLAVNNIIANDNVDYNIDLIDKMIFSFYKITEIEQKYIEKSMFDFINL